MLNGSSVAFPMLTCLTLDDSKSDAFLEGLSKILQNLRSSKRIIAVTGAGISVSAGIPDFRSAEGLYERVLNPPEGSGAACELKKKSLKGKDFFDANFFSNAETRPYFNRFVAELKEMSLQGRPTPTHLFLKHLWDDGKLLRWYTQNIDSLEPATGLETSTSGSGEKTTAPVVALHGSLDWLVCTSCKKKDPFSSEKIAIYKKGTSPTCSQCEMYLAERVANGRRPVKAGFMRPDIVLYNEPHPQGEIIADYVGKDISRRPTLLVVMGTSLKVVGLKRMVKDMSRAVKETPDGLVLFINKTPAPKGEWKDIFDFELLGECDKWVAKLEDGLAVTRARIQTKITLSAIPVPADKVKAEPALSKSLKKNPATPTSKKDNRLDKLLKKGRVGSRNGQETSGKENESPQLVCLVPPSAVTTSV